MLNPNSKSGGLAYSDQSNINHENSKELDALNDGFENEDDDDDSEHQTISPGLVNEKVENKKNDKEQDVPGVKPEKYDDLASSGT